MNPMPRARSTETAALPGLTVSSRGASQFRCKKNMSCILYRGNNWIGLWKPFDVQPRFNGCGMLMLTDAKREKASVANSLQGCGTEQEAIQVRHSRMAIQASSKGQLAYELQTINQRCQALKADFISSPLASSAGLRHARRLAKVSRCSGINHSDTAKRANILPSPWRRHAEKLQPQRRRWVLIQT